MTKFSTPDELIKIAEVNKNNAEKIEKINIIMRETACFGRRECHIYDSDLWNNEIISELINSVILLERKYKGFSKLHVSIFLGE